jgi:biopolymer transport protein ExbB
VDQATWSDGGPGTDAAIALGVLALFCVALSLDRAVVLWRARVHARRFDARIQQSLQTNDWETLALVAGRSDVRHAPEAHVVRAALEAWGMQKGAIDRNLLWEVARDAARLALSRQLMMLRQGQRAMAVVAVVAPLVGVVGCALDLVNVVRGLPVSAPGNIALALPGIGEALGPPIVGVLIALPAVLARAWLLTSVERRGLEASSGMHDLLARLAATGDLP